jgi:hypothetical protein
MRGIEVGMGTGRAGGDVLTVIGGFLAARPVPSK